MVLWEVEFLLSAGVSFHSGDLEPFCLQAGLVSETLNVFYSVI